MPGHRDFSASTLPRAYAGCGEPPIETDPLIGAARAHVAVIGGGITGASAALHLAQAGKVVHLLEAERIGSGGSGRAFGQVVPYLRTEPAGARAALGAECGERLVRAAAAAPERVRALVERHGIACDIEAGGLVFAAHAPSGAKALRARQVAWAERGIGLPLLDAAGAAAAIGGGRYLAALVEPRGLTLNPLAYTRGLARAARDAGARVHERSPVTALTRASTGWSVETAQGTVLCDTVIVAAGLGLAGLFKPMKRRLLPFRVHEAATAPLPAEALSGVLERHRALTDTRRLPSGVRRTGEGRLVVTLSGPSGASGAGDADAGLTRLRALFPQLHVPGFSEQWSGWVDLSSDQYPRLVEPAPGLLVGYGLSGRGLGLGTALGQSLAQRALGALAEDAPFPATAGRPRDWLLGSTWMAAAAAVAIRSIERRQADGPHAALSSSNGPRP
ncbi:NAD(P)/FAD-dependent oxidoreductase [Ancylobacter defluvii]|uniref:FAD-dependent oxidoreductase n=1 Tax=Ancylobacter defluvii TaxID=1282440 RepID=A0A9W6JS67_9HYPH|nr:FAD-binding oxidoreductase [Ancylobacter defluvii]MBS7590217.1 FAD-binding oxidoreductase [Ancylobacter defluvii]GLK82860.1 FAD-dependent oxidoreductase [Ancylobacter defluvii]